MAVLLDWIPYFAFSHVVLGIAPDIEVDNLPYATFMGEDAQLDAAIEYLQQRIEQRPVKPLTPKAYPGVTEPADDIEP